MGVRRISQLEQVANLSPPERQSMDRVARCFPFCSNDYYLSLIDWSDPNDPIRRAILPDPGELQEWGSLDPSDEIRFTVLPGMEHKYNSTVIILTTNRCEGICRYCFRKRVFLGKRQEVLRDIPAMTEYISRHTEITNVLLTGGDPLTLPTSALESLIKPIRKIDHVQIIRIGTKMPVFNPFRILEDPSLPDMIRAYSLLRKKLYIMTHFTHPRELTPPAVEAVELLRQSGAVVNNQCPLIRGINDNPDTLAELFRQLSFCGIIPYYLFQCRPTLGNRDYSVPIETAYSIIEQAKSRISGVAKRFRYVMSHASGKIEILAMDDDRIYMKYHRAAQDSDSGKFMIFPRNPQAYWLDDYVPAAMNSSA